MNTTSPANCTLGRTRGTAGPGAVPPDRHLARPATSLLQGRVGPADRLRIPETPRGPACSRPRTRSFRTAEYRDRRRPCRSGCALLPGQAS